MEHGGGAHPGADVGGAGGQVTKMLIVSDIELALEGAVDFVDQLEGVLQLQPGANRLHPQMILLVDHDAERLFAVHRDRTANSFGRVLAADEVALDQNLLLERGKVLEELGK